MQVLIRTVMAALAVVAVGGCSARPVHMQPQFDLPDAALVVEGTVDVAGVTTAEWNRLEPVGYYAYWGIGEDRPKLVQDLAKDGRLVTWTFAELRAKPSGDVVLPPEFWQAVERKWKDTDKSKTEPRMRLVVAVRLPVEFDVKGAFGEDPGKSWRRELAIDSNWLASAFAKSKDPTLEVNVKSSKPFVDLSEATRR